MWNLSREMCTTRLIIACTACAIVICLSLGHERAFDYHTNKYFHRSKPPRIKVVVRQSTPIHATSNSTHVTSNSTHVTSNLHSVFEVIAPKLTYDVGDTIRVRITARDATGNRKEVGGDYFRFKLHSPETNSSLGLDVTDDLHDGTYIAEATLRWPGKVRVIVTLVHSREALQVLDRVKDLELRHFVWKGRYVRNVGKQEVTEDDLCLPHVIPNNTLCNFTDQRTGYPWYCVAPTNERLTCNDWRAFWGDFPSCNERLKTLVTDKELDLLKSQKLAVTGIGPTILHVNGDIGDWKHDVDVYQQSLPDCSRGQHLASTTHTGFYHQNTWYSDQCRVRRFVTADDVMNCLSNRSVHLMGDSTAGQMFYELTGSLRLYVQNQSLPSDQWPGLRKIFQGKEKNITLTYRNHGLPLRMKYVERTLATYVVNALDDLVVDARSVVIIVIGTHYSTHMNLYEKRMRDVKAAVRRLHARSPSTLVVIKDSTTRDQPSPLATMQNSDWYIRDLNRQLREVFSDYPQVALIDAWDIVMPMNFPDTVHPPQPVVKNLVNLCLSFICPRG